jgi:hypothetical protein
MEYYPIDRPVVNHKKTENKKAYQEKTTPVKCRVTITFSRKYFCDSKTENNC